MIVLLCLLSLGLRFLVVWLHYQAHYVLPEDVPGIGGLLLRFLYGMRGKYLEVFGLGMLAGTLYVWGREQQRLPLSIIPAIKRGSFFLTPLMFSFFWLWLRQRPSFSTQGGVVWLFPPGGGEFVHWYPLAAGGCFFCLLVAQSQPEKERLCQIANELAEHIMRGGLSAH